MKRELVLAHIMRATNATLISFLIYFSFCLPKQELPINIRIGVPNKPSFGILILAEKKGFFKKNDLNVELIINSDVITIYQDRKVDFFCSSLTEPIILNSEGLPTQIIYRFSYSVAGDIIIANKNIKTLKDLKGKKISFDGINSSSHIFVEQLLNKNGVQEGDFFTANIPTKNVLEEIRKGSIDAGHTNISSLDERRDSDIHIIGRTADLPDLLTDVMSGNSNFLSDHPREANGLLTSLLQASEYYHIHRAEAEKIIADNLNIPVDLVALELNSIKFLSREQNIQSLQSGNINQNQHINQMDVTQFGKSNLPNMGANKNRGGLFLAAETIIQFLRERGQLYRVPDLDFLIINTYLLNKVSQ